MSAALHAGLAAGRWEQLTLLEQLANIGSEVGRATRAKSLDRQERFNGALDRCLELFDLTLVDERWRYRRREIARAREIVCDFLVGDNVHGSTAASLDAYFLPFAVAARARVHALPATTPADRDREGNLVDALARWLGRQGWTEISRAETALGKHGIDLVMEKDGRTRVIEVKGWPAPRHATGRNHIGGLVLSAMVLRSSRPNDEVALAVPDHETYISLLKRIRPSLETLGVGAYVIDERGAVKPFVAIEEVDAGRVSRDSAVDRVFVRRLVAMTDAQREAHFVSSNRAALEMLADARRAG